MRKIQFVFVNIIIIGILTSISCKKDKNQPFDDYRDYVFEEPVVTGNTFYIDPVAGADNGDGSMNNPWKTLQNVIESGKIEYYKNSENNNPNSPLVIVNEGAPVKGGDRLILKSGYHGHIYQSVFIFKDWLTIEAAPGNTPVLSQFMLFGAFSKIYLKGLTISRDSYQGTDDYWIADDINHNSNACVYVGSSSFWGKGSEIKLNGLNLRTTNNVSGWSAADWVQKTGHGIVVRNVPNVEITNCNLINIRMGISISESSQNTIVTYNTVKNFSGDGARIISNNVLFAYNTIRDCFKVDDNHDDCIQSWTVGEDGSVGTGVIKNVVIRGNLLIGQTDPTNPLAGNPQGIGCFDGFFENWIVENNLVITDHYHGISFYGMKNSKIINNTVIDQFPNDDTCPWIMVTDHKDNTQSFNCLVANNIVSASVSVSGDFAEDKNNYVIGKSNYQQIYNLFLDPDIYDFHLLNNSITQQYIIDKGEAIEGILSSEIDKDQAARTLPPDLGAFEVK